MTADLTRDEIWFLKALRAAGERGRTVSSPESRAGQFRCDSFNEGQNLAVIPGGFEADYEHLAELAASLVKAAPDAISSLILQPPLRALQEGP